MKFVETVNQKTDPQEPARQFCLLPSQFPSETQENKLQFN